MEYFNYILITLGILMACLLLMRLPAVPEKRERTVVHVDLAEKKNVQKENKDGLDIASRARLTLQREELHVPTPWGWPGHRGTGSVRKPTIPNSQEVHGVSESLYYFVDRLFSEKHTVDNREYLLRKDESLRSLVEDRYGRTSSTKEIPYRKVKSPLLRDPSEPHDQMDNFPSGKGDQIAAQIPRQAEISRVVKRKTPLKKTGGLQDVRTPWGW